MSERAGLRLAFYLSVLVAAIVLGLGTARADDLHRTYTADDTLAAIDEASSEIGVDYDWLYGTVACETAGTFDPYSVGRAGELGAAQLHPRGELLRFYRIGYLDPFSPYQAVRFMAQRFAAGGWRAWTCAR